MVGFLKRGQSLHKLRSLHHRPGKEEMCEVPERQAHSLVLEGSGGGADGSGEDKRMCHSHGEISAAIDGHQIGWALDRTPNKPPRSGPGREPPSDIEQMKERFAKLLLGEDMSGGGKGVSSALALSNAITNLAASVFGEQWRLEPMSAERKARWRKEIDWLLSVTDHIVEFVPSQQVSEDGTKMEIMVTQQRKDLLMNIPALRKLDTMLIVRKPKKKICILIS